MAALPALRACSITWQPRPGSTSAQGTPSRRPPGSSCRHHRDRRLPAIAGSLGADAVLVAVGQAVYPGTSGYEHFQFADYTKLTVILSTVR